MSVLMKAALYGGFSLAGLGATLAGSTLLFPDLFEPGFTVVAAPSGRRYRLMKKTAVAAPDAKALTLRYWADTVTEPDRLAREAGELMDLLRAEADEGNFDAVLIEAFQLNAKVGPMLRGETRTTVFKRPPGRWTDTVSPLAPKPRLGTVDGATRRSIEGLYRAGIPQLKGRIAGAAVLSSQVTIHSMALEDGEVVVRSTQLVMSRLKGPRGLLTVRTETKCRDTWVRDPPSWRVRLSEALETKTTFLD